MSITAIQTTYKGHRFRSRLEARWAVFFDEMHIEWVYEPQGFIDDWGEEGQFCYLPDFYLPMLGLWVEVKGVLSSDLTSNFARFLDFGSPLPNFDHSFYAPGKKGGLLVLGELPKVPTISYPWNFGHKLITHHNGLVAEWARFLSSEDIEVFDHQIVSCCLQYESDAARAIFFDPEPCKVFDPDLYLYYVNRAYRAATSARFEHGEFGAN